MEQKRQPAFEVTLEPNSRTITIHSPNGLNERAMRDVERLQWITVNHGWDLSERTNPNGPFTRARATFLQEEYVAAARYFEFANQGILVTIRGDL
jgi:predicted metal-dependent phosphoesterase TrpH